MSQVLSLFPTYEKDKSDIFSLSDYSFYYDKDDEEVELSYNSDESMSGEIVLEDETGYWTPDEYPLKFLKKIEVKNATLLYETDYKIACSDATIGIGLVWSSPSSNQKGAFDIGEIENIDRRQVYKINKTFPPGSLRGEVIFSIILFIKKPGKPEKDEFIYANEPGCKIGEIENNVVRIDGNGSFFPMKEVDRPGEPLWFVECNWTDPSMDSFSDSVSILLNRAHKSFRFIDRTDKDFQPQLLLEVLASAVGNMIETYRDYDKDFETIQDAQEGSVALAIRYFKDNLNWDISSPIHTSSSIRTFFEQKKLI